MIVSLHFLPNDDDLVNSFLLIKEQVQKEKKVVKENLEAFGIRNAAFHFHSNLSILPQEQTIDWV